jgi:hypothetical protein
MRDKHQRSPRGSVARGLVLIAALAAISWTAYSQKKMTVKPNLTGIQGLEQWEIDGWGEWTISEGRLVISKAGVPSGPIRRPAALAILRTPLFEKATIEAEIHSLAPLDVIRRDLDFVVSYESPTRFYYIHLAGVTDNVHNGIFLVNNADRLRIDSGKGKPQLQDAAWHRIRVERDGVSGRIRVYSNGSKTPVLEAVDTTIRSGRVGLGSFDDTGEFRNIMVTGSSK